MNYSETLHDRIRSLGDTSAIRALTTVARAQAHAGAVETELTQEAGAALEATFGGAGSMPAPAAGELARAALALLADDPETARGIEAVIGGPVTRSFDLGTTMLLASAVLIALQTHVRFERDKRGRLSILVEKRPTRDALLTDLAQKLLGWWRKGGA